MNEDGRTGGIGVKTYDFKDRWPEDGQRILLFRSDDPKSGWLCRANYCWFEYDEDGFTGRQILYDPKAEHPEGCRLHVMADGIAVDKFTVDYHFRWCPA